MVFDSSYTYIIFAFLTAIIFFIEVPKQHYKHYLVYGVIFGGFAEIVIDTVLILLNLIEYKNMGFFNVLNLFSSWTPVIWIFAIALFLYNLPTNRVFLIPYMLFWTMLTYSIGLVFQNFGAFEYIGFWKYAAPFLFIAWFSTTAWFYFRKQNVSMV